MLLDFWTNNRLCNHFFEGTTMHFHIPGSPSDICEHKDICASYTASWWTLRPCRSWRQKILPYSRVKHPQNMVCSDIFFTINKYKENRLRERCSHSNCFLQQYIIHGNNNNTHFSVNMKPEDRYNHRGTCLYSQEGFWFGRLKQKDVNLTPACDTQGGFSQNIHTQTNKQIHTHK